MGAQHTVGPILRSMNLTSLIIFACLRDVASGGGIRSASPSKMSVGTSLREMSLRKSSIQASTQAVGLDAVEDAGVGVPPLDGYGR